jgi:ABC-type phosphate/phosphonate transport system substrate-binding protein
VIAKSPILPEHVFAANKSMDPATFKKIQEALLTMDLPLMKGIKPSLTGMQKVNDKDFDILRKILDRAEKEKEPGK